MNKIKSYWMNNKAPKEAEEKIKSGKYDLTTQTIKTRDGWRVTKPVFVEKTDREI